jgi:hypothetical protein
MNRNLQIGTASAAMAAVCADNDTFEGFVAGEADGRMSSGGFGE